MKMKKAICHSGNPARIIRNPVKSITYWIPDSRCSASGMTKWVNGTAVNTGIKLSLVPVNNLHAINYQNWWHH